MKANDFSGKRLRVLLLAFIMVMAVFTGCAEKDKGDDQVTDYTDPANWESAPETIDGDVDILYLYPTVWSRQDGEEENICQEDDPRIIEGVARITDRQASVFEGFSNIFVPYYRQMDAALYLESSEEDGKRLMEKAPIPDGLAAFDYYIKNLNDGRPFILAGHSQGSMVLMEILADYMKENPQVYDRMIAAYVIGVAVTDGYLKENPHLKFAQGSADTGVIISYNCEVPEFAGTNPLILPNTNVINPINWKTDETPADIRENLGSLVAVEGTYTVVDGITDARVNAERGVLECSSVDPEALYYSKSIFEKGIYHMYDYSFFYNNLRQNAQDRIAAYFLQN